ncbi:MAG TPA: GAF domain-containing sensor histidine kinase [Chitinophagaceae bacterium]|jgi:signal transduction histidine kinase|nr:GAF domain-containing sensor histidine kinase [Chitinophagaceae bacterium]MBP9740248.1 GAF domain-containing sensor histidine kinase [Chitinophagaceae bacterium]HPH22435.1 GAF domain-containing sensor histidine kinase [Chitinophagaceae bacterium]
MKIVDKSLYEVQRLKELYKFDILDTPYEDEFDDIVKLASLLCNTSISTITLIDSSRQWFKAKVGLENRETSKEVSFCSYAIAANTDLYQVEDATKSIIFENNPLVTGNPNIRFYAGVPLVSSNGFSLGTLCVIDSQPKVLTTEQIFALKVLGNQVMKLLELRITNQQLEITKRKLQQQVELQNKIISIIAHDVRNPVASLKSIIELSNNDLITADEANELAVMTDKQIDDVLSLLDDLLDWGKIQLNNQNVIEVVTVNLYSLVESIFERQQAAVFIKENTLLNLIENDFELHTDENILRFILRNIIGNAIKFTTTGTITIDAQKTEQSVVISIQDTGVGITKEVIEKIMTTSNKYTSLGTNNEKGTGLGLVFVKDFIYLLKGKMWVESEVNKGTTFYIELLN